MHIDGKAGADHRSSIELAIHSPLARLPVILLQVHDKAAQQLKSHLQVLFDNADATLFEMADKARSDAEQSLFFEAMRDVRLKRKNIERSFLERLLYAFIKLTQPAASDSTLLMATPAQGVFSLLGNDLERAQVINAMVAKVLVRDQSALCHLSTRLNTLSRVVLNEQNNPLGPAMLCEYFLQAERDQGIEIKVKLIMLQLFEKYLLSHTEQLYADANQLLIATGVLPELSSATSCCSPKHTDDTRELPAQSEYASNLVGLLFEYIGGDRNLSTPLKKLIGQLQQPMLKIAQLDQNFFSCDSHPARRLLNVIAAAAIGWDSSVDCASDPLHLQISHVVQQLAGYSGHHPGLLESLLHDFLTFTQAEQEQVELLEQHIRKDERALSRQMQAIRPWLASSLPLAVFDEQDHLGLLLVSQLRIGTWIDQQDGLHLRCKLIVIVEPEGRYVFANRSGIKTLEISRADLIRQLRCGTILLLDDSLLFDRALASVIDSLG